MKVVVVTGTHHEHSQFLFDAVSKIVELSGNKDEFLIVNAPLDDSPREAQADLIFTQINDSDEVPRESYMYVAHWIRQPKHAYCMVSEEHPMGFHNYNNFRNIIVPLNLMFKPMRFDVDKEGKNISPATLIEALRPVKDEQES